MAARIVEYTSQLELHTVPPGIQVRPVVHAAFVKSQFLTGFIHTGRGPSLDGTFIYERFQLRSWATGLKIMTVACETRVCWPFSLRTLAGKVPGQENQEW